MIPAISVENEHSDDKVASCFFFVMVDVPKIGGEDSGESSLDGLNTTVNLAGDGHGLVAELDLGGEGSLKIMVMQLTR